MRSAAEVLGDHLRESQSSSIEDDLARNYAADLIVLMEGELAFVEWTAQGDGAQVDDGADSYLMRNGRIVAQTIHYTVRPAR